jgi:hypothetical protein
MMELESFYTRPRAFRPLLSPTTMSGINPDDDVSDHLSDNLLPVWALKI